MKRILWLMVLALVVMSCEDKEKAQMREELDLLEIELKQASLFAKTLEEVGVLMDSIDVSRQILRASVAEGTSYEDYKSRMAELNEYVKQSKKRITNLELALQTADGKASSYASSIRKLKADLELKSQELLALQEMVEDVSMQNQNLVQTVAYKEEQLTEKSQIIELKELELSKVERRVQELMQQSREDEADAYYARAIAIEEAANRTKFAPKKKKETRLEALELYRLALVFGKEEAKERIEILEQKL